MASSEQHAHGISAPDGSHRVGEGLRVKRDVFPMLPSPGAAGVTIEFAGEQHQFKGGQSACTYLVLCYPRDAHATGVTPANDLQEMRAWLVPGAQLASFVLEPGLGEGEALQVSQVCPLLTWDAVNRERQLPCYQSMFDRSSASLGGCNVPPIPSAGIYGLVSATALRRKSPPGARARRGRALARRGAGRTNGNARLDAR